MLRDIMVFLKKITKVSIEGKIFHLIWNKLFPLFTRMDFWFGFVCRWIYMHFLKVEPNKIVVFQCQNRYACNPKYVVEALYAKRQDLKFYWVFNKKPYPEIPAYIKPLQRFSFEAYRHILTAKVIIDNGHTYQEGTYCPKQRGQYLIQTWHGSLGFKRFDTDSNKRRVKSAKRSASMTDFCISNSTFETNKVYRGTFWSRSKIFEFGHPRNDILIKNKDINLSLLRSKLGLPSDSYVVLYAPTFRDKNAANVYSLDIKRLINSIENLKKKDCYVLWRYHMITSRKFDIDNSKVINVTSYPDIQELMLISDMGITDYSSWLCDFMLLRRPAFLLTFDMPEYEKERGLYYSLNEYPFPLASTNDELIENIVKFNQSEYEAKIDSFLTRVGCIEDGHACDRVSTLILKLLR